MSAKTPIRALLVGLAATGAVAALHLCGLGSQSELRTLDMRMRWLPNAPADPQVVHVDIDDLAIEALGRWPWPRERLAGIVQAIEDAGAAAVVLDIILPDPQELRYESAAETLYDGAEQPATSRPWGDPDETLLPPRRVFDDAMLAAALARHDNIFLPMHIDFAAGAPASRPQSPLRRQAVGVLERLAQRLRGGGLRLPEGQMTPPLVVFARQIHHTGFVTAQKDADGVLRRAPLLARTQVGVYPQISLALAADRLGTLHGGAANIRTGNREIVIECADGFRRPIPVDDQGFLRINWPDRLREYDGVRHITAAAPGSVAQLRKALSSLDDLSRQYEIQAARKLGQTELLNLVAQADELYSRRVAAMARQYRQELEDPQKAQLLASAVELIGEMERDVEAAIDRQVRELHDDFYLQNATPQERQDVMALRKQLADVDARRNQLQNWIDTRLERLRAVLADKVVFLGSNSTAAGDFVASPSDGQTPGVVAHSSAYGTMMSGAFVRGPTWWADLLAITVCGLGVTLLAWRTNVAMALPLALAGMVAYACANALLVWRLWSYWLALLAPLAAGGAALLAVTAYRQLTEERAKRQIRRLFAQALSPSLVDRLIADPSMARLGGERREITCFFSDLEGFTALSHRLGERRTVQVLNRYFDAMTEVIQSLHGGYLNKFLGDGVLALFGAPVAQADHPARAVAAAVDCQRTLKALAGELPPGVNLRARIGLATGEVMVGNCGSTQRMDYTAIGDVVNLSSRLESANKFFGTWTLVAGDTWARGGAGVAGRSLGSIVVVGRPDPLEVWEPLPDGGEAQWLARFAEGLKLYRLRRFAEAAEAFEAAAKLRPDDRAAKEYAARCLSFSRGAPDQDWPAIRLAEK